MCKRVIILILVFALITIGCGKAKKDEAVLADETQTYDSMEVEPDLIYEVPDSLPHILVDQLGYLKDSKKVAIFYGMQLPESFDVINDETNETVYSGNIEDNIYSELYNTNVAMGDFSSLEDKGSYHIKCDYLGTSYSFRIDDELYDNIFKESCKAYYYNRCGMTLTKEYAGKWEHNACHTQEALLREDITVSRDVSGGWHQDSTGSKNTVDASYTLGNLLLSYEMFEKAFTDDTGIPESSNDIPDILDEIRYEVEWLLKMQDENTGEVFSGITVSQNGNTTIIYIESSDYCSSMMFAFALAKFSYIYQGYDKDFSTLCLRAADRAYKYASINEAASDDADIYKFAAASELYRASGSSECFNFLKEYLGNENNLNCDDELFFLSSITYLNNKQKVDTKLCENIMKNLMKDAETISAKARKKYLPVSDDFSKNTNAELLSEMQIMTIVDHIISNKEYDTLIENYIHYFMGRNMPSISYIDGVGERNYEDVDNDTGIMSQFDLNSKLILMLSRIISHDGFVEE